MTERPPTDAARPRLASSHPLQLQQGHWLARWGSTALVLGAIALWATRIAATGRWPAGDGPHSLGIATRLGSMLASGQLGELFTATNSLIAPHPPGAYVAAALGYALAGLSPTAHLVGAALVLALCWDGLRRLGAGLPSAIWLFGLAPIWLEAESYGIDLVIAAVVLQSLSHLVASDRLSIARHAIGWGAWMGVAFITKYTGPMYLVAPCLLAGWWTLRHRRFRALGLAIAGFGVTALPWWLTHTRQASAYILYSNQALEDFSYNSNVVTAPWWELGELSWYPAVALDAWGWLGGWAMGLAVLGPKVRGARPGALAVPILAGLGGWLILSTQDVREARYLVPLLVLSAAIVGTSRLRWVLAGVGVVSLTQLAPMYFDTSPAPESRHKNHDIHGAGGGWPTPPVAFRPLSLDPGPWFIDEILVRTRQVHGRDDGTVGFLIDEHRGAPGVRLILLRTGQLGYRWHLASPSLIPGQDLVMVLPFTTETWPSREYETLVAMIRPGDGDREQRLRDSGLSLVETWALPKGMEARLYTRDPP